MLDVAAACLCVTALLAYLNHRFVGLPSTVGVMAIALVLSLAVIALDATGISPGLHASIARVVRGIDFGKVLLEGMLSLLLFAGALQVRAGAMKHHAWHIAALAVGGTLVSTLAIGFAMWRLLPSMGLALPLVYCLVFGALISPTDPVAVMGIMRSAGAPASVETVITGESLFNDGVGVVIFLLMAGVAATGVTPGAAEGALLLAREAGGGILFGLALGWVTYALLKSIDEYQVEVMLTLAAVIGGYALASHLHVSGPLAMVVAGIIVGNRGRELAMSDRTRSYVDMFWELVDEILNAVLFVLLGIEILLFPFRAPVLMAGAAAIAVTLVARLLTAGLPALVGGRAWGLPRGAWMILTWGALRGGISVALALSLPHGPERDIVLSLTYCVVVVSILVQGLTLGPLVRRICMARAKAD